MKKVYRFNLIPGVEFVEEGDLRYIMYNNSDRLTLSYFWASMIKSILIKYDNEIQSRNEQLDEKDKEIKTHKNAVSVLQGLIESTKETAENERKHRDDLIKEKDKEIEELTKKLKNAERNSSYLGNKIEYLRKRGGEEINHRNSIINEKDKEIEYLRDKLREEIMKSEAYKERFKIMEKVNAKLNEQIAESPITKSPIPLSSTSDCSDFYICTPDHITYGPIAGKFGIGLYVGDTLILLKGDKASEAVYERNTMFDKINTLEETLKKKDETIKKLRNTAEFANDICDGYSALTNSLMNAIEEKNSEIKVLSDQVTRLMDQLKENIEGKPGCKSCMNGPEPCCDICVNTDCEHRVEKEAKPETNFDKIMADMHSKLTPARLAEIIKTSECDGVSCEDCLFNSIAEPGHLAICDMPLGMLTKWLEENTKED